MPTIANIDAGSFTQWAGFLDDIPVFADAQGTVRIIEGKEKCVEVHDGILCTSPYRDGKALVSGGEDGKICRTRSDGSFEIVHQASSNWIDKIASGPDSIIAYGSGRKGAIIHASGEVREIEIERSIEGLAFAPKGMRLAIARYDGVELMWVNTNSANQFLEWKGAHTGVMFSPDGKYVVSTMQENALHGWRLSDNKNMRMSGYPSKVASAGWSFKGKWLATSGAPAAIVWLFSGKDGPMGKAPKELGAMGKTMVTQVCCHPSAQMLAIGYENGMIMAVRIDDGKTVSLRREGMAAISTLGWDKAGARLAFGSEDGEAGVIDVSE
jgi:WD40 repeat protein